MTEASKPLQLERRGAVEFVRIDAGRTNAVTPMLVRALRAALIEAEQRPESRVLLLAGRPGIFCSGLDPAALDSGGKAGGGPDGEAAAALQAETEALVRALLASRLRIVSCVNGHAIGAGALLLLASDQRIAARGDFRIGFPEVGTGRRLSAFTVALARQRLNRRCFEAATLLGRLYTPADAVDVGFVDRVEGAGKALRIATDTAEGLAKLPEAAYVDALARVRGALLEG